jgi:hypothetical protein
VTNFRERWQAPYTPLELREMWLYSDGEQSARAFRQPDGAAESGRWTLADGATGNVLGELQAGEFSRRFRPVDVFADVTGFPTYLRTVTGPDGTAPVDLILDRNPFMLATGDRRAARPHVLIVPRCHRDGWSSATGQELAARQTAMTLTAGWYRSLDGGHAVFAANDSAPNLDYLRDADATAGAAAGQAIGAPVRRNPRQEVQHAHLHAFYAEDGETENRESSSIAQGVSAFSDTLRSGDAVRADADPDRLAASVRAAADPWGGSYCSYQLGVAGTLWVMPALGPSQDEFNRRLARADGLRAEPDARLGGAVNLARPSLADPDRLRAAERAIVEHKASFAAFAAGCGG